MMDRDNSGTIDKDEFSVTPLPTRRILMEMVNWIWTNSWLKVQSPPLLLLLHCHTVI
jgi:hypothetical protein